MRHRELAGAAAAGEIQTGRGDDARQCRRGPCYASAVRRAGSAWGIIVRRRVIGRRRWRWVIRRRWVIGRPVIAERRRRAREQPDRRGDDCADDTEHGAHHAERPGQWKRRAGRIVLRRICGGLDCEGLDWASAVESGRVASPMANAAEIVIGWMRTGGSWLWTLRTKTSECCPTREGEESYPVLGERARAKKSHTRVSPIPSKWLPGMAPKRIKYSSSVK
jgi:hypothetical protein